MKSRYPSGAGCDAACSGIPFEQLLYDLPDPLCLLDEKRSFVFTNRAFQAATGYEPSDMLGRSCFEIFLEYDHSSLESGFVRSEAQSCSLTFQGTIHGKNGCLIPLSLELQKTASYYLIKARSRRSLDEENLALQFDRKLKEQQRQLSQILERIGDGFFAVDESSRVTHWNRQAEQILGKKREDVLTQEIWRCFPEAVNTSFYLYYNKALKEQRAQQYEAFIPQEEKWLEVSLYPSLSGMTGFIRDISERKVLYEQLELHKREHQQKITAAVIQAQEKERAHVGQELHDNVNQVLTTVKLYTELCLSRPDNLDAILEKSVRLLQSCISEIRTLSWKLSAPTLGKIRMKDSIGELTHAVSETGKIKIITNYQCLADAEVSDELHLAIYRIIQEHLTNVLKHAAASCVEISVDCQDREFILKILDNGRGFDPAAKKTGIGISNMISRAESLGGRLSINSAPGLGCVLIVQLPFS